MKLKYCLLVLAVSSFLASLIQTNFGKVDVTLERLDTNNSQYIYYDLYKPKNGGIVKKMTWVSGDKTRKVAANGIASGLSPNQRA